MITLAQLLYTLPRWIELLGHLLKPARRWIGRARGWLRKADEALASAADALDGVQGWSLALSRYSDPRISRHAALSTDSA